MKVFLTTRSPRCVYLVTPLLSTHFCSSNFSHPFLLYLHQTHTHTHTHTHTLPLYISLSLSLSFHPQLLQSFKCPHAQIFFPSAWDTPIKCFLLVKIWQFKKVINHFFTICFLPLIKNTCIGQTNGILW